MEKNEKFGLLGYNGSGKSTTFKAITREILLDEGFIEIFNYNNSDDFEILRKNIGYCPQNYALFDNLTVNETFAFYDKIKSGVLKKDNNNFINDKKSKISSSIWKEKFEYIFTDKMSRFLKVVNFNRNSQFQKLYLNSF